MIKKLKNLKYSIFIVLLGVLLICIQSYTNRPLWLDESYLSLNIIEKPFKNLFFPLDYNQVAPILFLNLEKAFAIIFNYSEFGLRFVPFLCSILSLFLFEKILNLIFLNKKVVLFCISMFAFNITFLDYANEVKQYMVDLFFLLLILYLLFNTNNIQLKFKYLFILSIIGIFISNISPLFIFTIFIFLIYKSYKKANHSELKLLLIYSSLVFITFILYFLLFVYNHPAKIAMIQEWKYNRAFLPLNNSWAELSKFIYERTRQTFTNLISYGNIIGYLILMLYILGIFQLFKNKKNGLFFLLVLPILLHLFLSSLQLYPYEKRLILYQIPLIIIVSGFGFNFFLNKKNLEVKILSFLYPFIFFCSFLNYNRFPIIKTDIMSSLNFVKNNAQNNDLIYVSYLSSIPFKYYFITQPDIISKKCIYISGQKTLEWDNKWSFNKIVFQKDLEKLLENDRIWLLFSMMGDEDDKNTYSKKYLSSMDYNLVKQFEYNNSYIYLFKKNLKRTE